MKSVKEWANTQVIGMIVMASIFILVVALLFLSNSRNFGSAPATVYSPAIPESSLGAKGYIDQAASAAEVKDYTKALQILDEAIAAFPNDKNLKLTKEFYSIEASNYAQ